MKTLSITIFLLFTISFYAAATSFVFPQDTVEEESGIIGAFEMDFELSAFNTFDENEVFVRQPNKLSTTYSGYKIELLRVYNQPLDANDELLRNVGGVEVEKIGENTYAYLIGDFKTKQGMLDFLEKVIKPKYGNAKALVYKKGLRVKEL